MISTIDLDPKPVHRIPTWVMRKEEYLQVNFSLNFDLDWNECRINFGMTLGEGRAQIVMMPSKLGHAYLCHTDGIWHDFEGGGLIPRVAILNIYSNIMPV